MNLNLRSIKSIRELMPEKVAILMSILLIEFFHELTNYFHY